MHSLCVQKAMGSQVMIVGDTVDSGSRSLPLAPVRSWSEGGGRCGTGADLAVAPGEP